MTSRTKSSRQRYRHREGLEIEEFWHALPLVKASFKYLAPQAVVKCIDPDPSRAGRC